MREIGVRELKQSLSKTLRDVESGVAVRVTSHGRPIAEIVPAAPLQDVRTRELVAAGRLSLPSRPLPKRPPRRAKPRGRTASEIIIAEREEDR